MLQLAPYVDNEDGDDGDGGNENIVKTYTSAVWTNVSLDVERMES